MKSAKDSDYEISLNQRKKIVKHKNENFLLKNKFFSNHENYHNKMHCFKDNIRMLSLKYDTKSNSTI